jgi:hypothetical protein
VATSPLSTTGIDLSLPGTLPGTSTNGGPITVFSAASRLYCTCRRDNVRQYDNDIAIACKK